MSFTIRGRGVAGCSAAAVLALSSAWAADPTVTSAVYSAQGTPPDIALAAYRALSASQSRNYERAQDISPRQMVILLEVSERTGASLGQALATGEHESARTWNDYVRPTLKNGNLGSATGVWQFQPATFHRIVERYGGKLLAASEADAATDRERMDLGEGPFTDEKVRAVIRETMDGRRGADDEELQLLRHNFAVLAFAKHYLSVDSGATTPEEDYLYHFLGAGQGKRVLALARGEARDTLCVKPVEVPVDPADTVPELQAGAGITAEAGARAAFRPTPPLEEDSLRMSRIGRDPFAPVSPVWRVETRPDLSAGADMLAVMRADAALRSLNPLTAEPGLFPFETIPPSSEWGLPADSATVTGNPGMFYRDGKTRAQPYTWGEFLENLARRVRAADQPALVRAKYGVGFELKGGDMPERAFKPEEVSEVAEFRYENGQTVLVAEALVTGTLDREETQRYKQRLAALVDQGDDLPLDTLPPETLSALHRLKMLPAKVLDGSTANPEIRKALHNLRRQIGKDEPDDPAHSNLLMPAERIALEIYDRRIARYAALQACQQSSLGTAPDLGRMAKMPSGLRRSAAPHIAMVQEALAERGLLTRPTKKNVWRDKKRRKHVTYKTAPFAGKPDKATLAALDTFQLRNGLRRTGGVLDAVTLEMLGLPAMGPEIFLPLSGPQCAIETPSDPEPVCAIPTRDEAGTQVGRMTRRATRRATIL